LPHHLRTVRELHDDPGRQADAGARAVVRAHFVGPTVMAAALGWAAVAIRLARLSTEAD
jgi:hypothetical protein